MERYTKIFEKEEVKEEISRIFKDIYAAIGYIELFGLQKDFQQLVEPKEAPKYEALYKRDREGAIKKLYKDYNLNFETLVQYHDDYVNENF